MCSLRLEQSPRGEGCLSFGRRTQQLPLALPRWLVVRLLQVNTSRLQNSSFPAGRYCCPGCLQISSVFSISSKEVNIVFTSTLSFGAYIGQQCRAFDKVPRKAVSSVEGSISICQPEKTPYRWLDPKLSDQAECPGSSNSVCFRVLLRCRVSLLPDSVSPHSASRWKCQILALWSSFISLRRLAPIFYS